MTAISFRVAIGFLLWVLVAASAAGAGTLDGGSDFTCAVTPEGGAQCWGHNDSGQLGDGTRVSSGRPVPVSGLSSGVVAIATGALHACAVTAAGGVLCWGANGMGELGTGSSGGFSDVPVPVVGLASGVAAVAAGTGHTCALTSAGGVLCWGRNFWGEVGDGTTTQQNAPVPVSGLSSGVAAIAAGSSHTCALTTAGAALCWGGNGDGQTGKGTATTREVVPVPVSGLSSGVATISGGSGHTCASTTSGGALCWGANISGQLGIGSFASPVLVPTAVVDLSSGVAAVAASGGHTCAATASGVVCWGANSFGEVGDGTTANRSSPVAVSGLAGEVTDIGAGISHSCARVAGSLRCWGRNDWGELGNGIPMHTSVPLPVVGLSASAASIDAGFAHTCVSTADSGMWCWGDGGSGALGTGGFIDFRYAIPTIASGVALAATGGGHSCAVTTGGAALCWGSNGNGQLGLGHTNVTPVVTALSTLASGVAEIAPGRFHTCARTTAGAALCWGRNASGQVGDGSDTQRTLPTAVSGLSSGTAAMAGGGFHSCAVTTGGAALCWGANESGQLGDGSNAPSSVPVPVVGLDSGVAAITAGNAHTCALTSAGAALCWGGNDHGQLGDGSNAPSSVPVAVSGLASGVASLDAGVEHTCAVTTGGALRCWGRNDAGQLGDGTTHPRSVPVPVVGLAGGVVDGAAGSQHTCAVTSDGAVRCWGHNDQAQLGEGSPTKSLVPVGVMPFASPVPALGAVGRLLLVAGLLLASAASQRRRAARAQARGHGSSPAPRTEKM